MRANPEKARPQATRRSLLTGGAGLLLLAAGSRIALSAQSWPARPVRLVTGGAPGSVPDILARSVGQQLGTQLGQQVVVDNRPGAGGITAMQAVVSAAPDGYTIGLATISQAVFNPYLFRDLPYAPLTDLQPVAKIVEGAMVIAVNPGLKADTLAGLIALMRAKPGGLFIGTPALGTPPHLIALMLTRAAGVEATIVPFTTGPEALQAVANGDVQVFVDGPALVAPHVKAGRLRALAVTGRTRTPELPDVPTVGEAGLPQAQAETWFGIVAPAATPAPVVQTLNHEAGQLFTHQEFRQRIERMGFTPSTSSVEAFATALRTDHQHWGSFIRETGLRLGS